VTILVPVCVHGAAHDGRCLRRIARRLVASLLPAVCALLPLLAIAGNPSPVDLVKDTTSRMLTALKAEKADIDRDEGRLYTLISDIALPHFDFNRMGMWVLGPYWRSATPPQRERFVAEFRQLLVRTYGHTLMDYRDMKISYLPLLAAPDARQVNVRCEIEQAGGNPIQLVYAMYLTGDGWKVYDVLVDGVSLVTNYRSSFAAIIREQGMDSLIRQLAQRNGASGQ
jgi:phospholipid transport system substrate-binding protein